MLEDDVWTRAIGDRYGSGGCEGAVGLLVCLEDFLLRGRVPQRHWDGHSKGSLGLVDGAEGTLVVDVGGVGLHVLVALLLVAGKGGDGEGRA